MVLGNTFLLAAESLRGRFRRKLATMFLRNAPLVAAVAVKTPKYSGRADWEAFHAQFELLADAGGWTVETKARDRPTRFGVWRSWRGLERNWFGLSQDVGGRSGTVRSGR